MVKNVARENVIRFATTCDPIRNIIHARVGEINVQLSPREAIALATSLLVQLLGQSG